MGYQHNPTTETATRAAEHDLPDLGDAPAERASSADSAFFYYLYCIVEAGTEAARLLDSRLLAGIHAAERLFPIERDGLVAAVSRVPADAFDEQALEELTADLRRLAPFALRHEEAVSALLRVAPAIVPLTFGAVFQEPGRIVELLRERRSELLGLIDHVRERREWGVKVFWDVERTRNLAESTSDALRELSGQAAAAPPGRAYLLGRRREQVLAAEVDWLADDALRELVRRLTASSDDVRRDALTSQSTGTPPLIYKASLLVSDAAEDSFRSTVVAAQTELAPRGLTIELNGPWAPYAFVRFDGENAASGRAVGDRR